MFEVSVQETIKISQLFSFFEFFLYLRSDFFYIAFHVLSVYDQACMRFFTLMFQELAIVGPTS